MNKNKSVKETRIILIRFNVMIVILISIVCGLIIFSNVKQCVINTENYNRVIKEMAGN